jgi:hypothetical protein
LNKIKSFILLATLVFGVAQLANAQSSLNAENMALGGGGSVYLNGFEALFVNPANLYIQEKNYRLQISLLQGGAYFDSALPIQSPTGRFNTYRSTLLPYSDPNENRIIDDAARATVVEQIYPGNRRFSTLQSQTDFYWFGMKWYRNERSYAMALRTRSFSTYEIGRGYFSTTPLERNGTIEVNKSFSHNYQSLHELSFGYAESFTFINGLIPRLSEFIVGIAPKVIFAGSYLDAEYSNVYRRNADMDYWNRTAEYSQTNSGYFNRSNLTQPEGASLSDIFRPSGVGLGVDLGITYLITFGSDLSVLRREDMLTEKSLRFSFSINDLGAIYHFNQPQKLSAPTVEEETETTGSTSGQYFLGAPNEHLYFLGQFDDSPLELINEVNTGSFETILPTTINAGAMFQINRIKLMGDISYNLTKNRFSPNIPIAYVGLELRPLPFLPLRAGTRLAPTLPGYYSFGTGLETSYFDISAAVQLRSRNIGPTTEILAASLVGIKFYIP